MTIGAMLRTMAEQQGIGVYTQNLMNHLLPLDQHNEYVLFHRDPRLLGQYAQYRNVRERLVTAPNKLISDQVKIPLASRREGVDVILRTRFTVPTIHQGKDRDGPARQRVICVPAILGMDGYPRHQLASAPCRATEPYLRGRLARSSDTVWTQGREATRTPCCREMWLWLTLSRVRGSCCGTSAIPVGSRSSRYASYATSWSTPMASPTICSIVTRHNGRSLRGCPGSTWCYRRSRSCGGIKSSCPATRGARASMSSSTGSCPCRWCAGRAPRFF